MKNALIRTQLLVSLIALVVLSFLSAVLIYVYEMNLAEHYITADLAHIEKELKYAPSQPGESSESRTARLVLSARVGEDGFIAVCDQNFRVLLCANDALIGVHIEGAEQNRGTIQINSEKYIYGKSEYENSYIFAIVSHSEILGDSLETGVVSAIAITLFAIAMIVAVNVLCKRKFLSELRSLSRVLDAAAKGETEHLDWKPRYKEIIDLERSLQNVLNFTKGEIDEERRMSHEAEQNRQRAETADRAKTSFIANISHELRTPLAAVIGYTELALDDVLTERAEDYLHKIRDSSAILLVTIGDILDIAKLDSGYVAPEYVPISITDIVRTVKNICQPKATAKNISFATFTEQTAIRPVYGDPNLLRQCLLNLVYNALKFTKSGIVKLTVDTESEYEDKHIKMAFEVSDTGIGMTAEQLEAVFQPFVQAKGETSRRYGGTGLGLAITKSFVELMGGKLTAESSPGIGSRFSFVLPFRCADDDSVPVIKRVNESPFDGECPHLEGDVLVVDDDMPSREIITAILEKSGLKVYTAENGWEGVSIASARKQNPFKLIFMDVVMQGQDGLESAKKIKALGVTTPIVIMTADSGVKDNGVNDAYILKPFYPSELWSLTSRLL
ncbi:MAG: response regulator [Oscillospiraceae bacterium]|jgi:signal transduction histidine kinase|nr:response regulator [Oscillospiraceae bacterium]